MWRSTMVADRRTSGHRRTCHDSQPLGGRPRALDRGVAFGIWGGATEDERRAMCRALVPPRCPASGRAGAAWRMRMACGALRAGFVRNMKDFFGGGTYGGSVKWSGVPYSG